MPNKAVTPEASMSHFDKTYRTAVTLKKLPNTKCLHNENQKTVHRSFTLQKVQDKPGLLESCLKIKEVMMWKRTGTQTFTLECAPKPIATYVREQ